MKTTFLFPALLAATQFVGFALAETAPVSDRDAALIQRHGTNRDGTLDDTEKKTLETAVRARVEKRPRLLKQFDSDGDGKPGDAEWTAARGKIIGRLIER